MSDAISIVVKALAGGGLVVVFSLLGEVLQPKSFAGLFGAAPAVAIAGLTVLVADKGAGHAHDSSIGMIAGALAMFAYCLLTVRLLRRRRAASASALALVAWVTIAGGVYAALWA